MEIVRIWILQWKSNFHTNCNFHAMDIVWIYYGFSDAMNFTRFSSVIDHNYTKTAQAVTNLQQTCDKCCSNNLSTGCVRTACSQLVDNLHATMLLSSTDL